MTRSRAADNGSAVVEFLLVGTLVLAMALALIQLGLALHVRNVLLSCAADGARLAARADRDEADGAARAEQLAAASLPGVAVAAVGGPGPDGTVEVRLTAALPVWGPLGVGDVAVTAHALEEADDGTT